MHLVITLDPDTLPNPDLDLRYELPDMLEELSAGRLKNDGYEYTAGDAMEVYLEVAPGVDDPVALARALLKDRLIYDNDIIANGVFEVRSGV